MNLDVFKKKKRKERKKELRQVVFFSADIDKSSKIFNPHKMKW